MPPRSRGSYPGRRGGRGNFPKIHSRLSPAPEEVHEIISLDEESDNSSVVVLGSRVKQPLRDEQRRPRATTRPASTRTNEQVVPDVYLEMLQDASSSNQAEQQYQEPPLKRRRVGSGTQAQPLSNRTQEDVISIPTDSPRNPSPPRQIVYNDDESSEESELDWEEVDLAKDTGDTTSAPEDLNIVIGAEQSGPKRKVTRRRPINASERRARLDIHKTHLLCLLAHACMRSTWCNDGEVQSLLRPLMSKKTQSYLVPNENFSQFQRSRSFMDGLGQASELWRTRFDVTCRGLKCAVWAEDEETLKNYKLPEDADAPMELSEFRTAAKQLKGSRDIGAQLFCALLRSVGVTARLLCSLQPLSFSSSKPPPQPSTPKYIYAETESPESNSEDDNAIDLNGPSPAFGSSPAGQGSGSVPVLPPRIRRIGQPSFGEPRRMDAGKPPPTPKLLKKNFRESPFPVYWVEAFNEAVQKWIPVDPLVTKTIAKPSKFEPPASDPENTMSYVVALEAEGEVKDVTRRYAKAYNAKTRKLRVESTKGGDRWWYKSLRKLRRGWVLDRDQVEDGELAAREASEEMPRNVQDFKDHPYYALERHLRRNEVLHPKREVGKVSVAKISSSSRGKVLEPIFRRRDVHLVKSADGWYRQGREIKAGEQPLKFVPTRRNQVQAFEDEDDRRDAEDAGVGLYAEFQTTLYEPPPIIDGRVPKNAFGNLDIYVPTMVPKGGIHIADREAARAAGIVGVDYADAVTGFEFRGRQGTAVIRGIIAPSEYQEAIKAVIQGLRNEQAAAEEALKSAEALRMWKRFLVALRIKERISGYDIEGMQEEAQGNSDFETAREDAEAEAVEEGGGFFMDRDQAEIAEPTVQRSVTVPAGGGYGSWDAPRQDFEPEYISGGGFFLDDNDAGIRGGGFLPEEDNVNEGGGFVAEDDGGEGDEREGGGFLVDDNYKPAEPIPTPSIPEPTGQDQTSNLEEFDSGGGFLLPEDKDASPAPATDAALGLGTDVRNSTEAPQHTKEKSPDESTTALGQDAGLDQDESDELEKGSLLSHDPEDEDADPDWLVDD